MRLNNLNRQKKKTFWIARNAPSNRRHNALRSGWILFYDPNYEAEVATTQFRIRPEPHYRQEQGTKARLKFSLKASLPSMERKVSLIVDNSGEGNNLGGAVDDTTENAVVGLQFFGKQRSS